MAVTTVRLRAEVEQQLESLSSELHRSKGWLINEAVAEYSTRREQEKRRWRETLEAMEAVARGEVVDGEEVHAWLRSWGDPEELPPPKPGQ